MQVCSSHLLIWDSSSVPRNWEAIALIQGTVLISSAVEVYKYLVIRDMTYVWLLKFGVSADNKLVNIVDVSSGKSDLVCPYCGVKLVAKKGQIKEHHFAHTG
ncbi:competence protein CoiA family protein [Coleofasciculus sp. FACHB-SPT9]|uniref:competence protein CoiA family protein n=1 Tax=Cyanophyceae TaxID=3028117 RepID=UPI001F557AFE|nr:competence protein CoiA family protein [Coleofasciculus sp. FACHB-SPT9]